MVKNIFTIPPDAPFIPVLAVELWERAGSDAARLSDMLVLLPTRRSCRALRDAFASIDGKPASLLPRMQPLGDIDEDEFYFADTVLADLPPAIAPMRRQLLLTQLIHAKDASMPLDQAAQMAAALALFLDQTQIEDCDLSRLKDLVTRRELAQHWQQTLEFLNILTDVWPKILESEGCIDPALRRGRLLRMQAEIWRKQPPAFPVIAAGSTGTVPAVAELLDVIASMPQGAVILPGLDCGLNEEAWQNITPTHPQYNLKRLTEKCGVKREAVSLIGAGSASQRMRLIQTSMLPAEVTEQWRELKSLNTTQNDASLISLIEADHPQEEAQVIALILRHALETPNKTAALVTPDRGLAERVSMLLTRWNINANDSGGTSLAAQPVGAFLLDILDAAKPQATSVALLSLLKHPYAACGLDPSDCRTRARDIEIAVFRNDEPEISEWLESVKRKLNRMGARWFDVLSVPEWIALHRDLAEEIAATATQNGADIVWQSDAGEAASLWLDDWRQAAQDFLPCNGADYAALFTQFMRTQNVRPQFGQHPRINIWGALEARLMQPDLVILGGLNETIWPPEAEIDPWMSRPMKQDFGLPSPERVIGLAAHDFVQLACAPEVVLTRAKRAGTSPTVPSRFLLQLQAVLESLGYDPATVLRPAQPWLDYARALDTEPNPQPCAPPEPKPPLDARPRELSVTEIGTWRRNPYALYAKHILKLEKLDPLEAGIDAADRGNLVHEALEKFINHYPDQLPPDALDQLLAIGRDLFAVHAHHPEVLAFWWPRFERIAAWFVEQERTRRAVGIRPVQCEASGRMALTPDFALKGRADRIDRLPDGKLSIVDYKTGSVPSGKMVKAGFEPQMPLLAMLAASGAFAGVNAAETGELSYWKLSGGSTAGEDKPISGNLDELVDQADKGLRDLVALFANADTPYQAVPKPQYQTRYDDYAHLARLGEWGRVDDDGGEA